MSEEIKKARETMRDAFDNDSDFKEGYRSNIGMLLYDEGVIISRERRNEVADKIIKKVFYD